MACYYFLYEKGKYKIYMYIYVCVCIYIHIQIYTFTYIHLFERLHKSLIVFVVSETGF